MIGKTTLNELKKETISNVEAILSKDIKNEIPSDNIIKFQLKMVFIDETIPNTIKYPNLEDSQCLLLSTLVAFISILFNMSYNERKELYIKSIYKIDDEKIKKAINEL